MKIWSLDKLQRMIDTMFNKETGEDPHYSTRHAAAGAQQKGRPADLQKLLQNEKMDRDYTITSQDMIPLRGYHVYVHDMDELTRPVMVREYPKVEKEKGKWPQFRASGNGKCPFVEDPHFGRRQQEEQQQEERRAQRALAAAPRTRAASAMQEKVALAENNNFARRPSAPAVTVRPDDDVKPLDPPQGLVQKCATTDGAPPMFGSAQASIRAMPRFIGGEPVASGMQQNITSAIQSQMISSTAAAPRAGNSKEVNQLQRKVLEKNSVTSANSGHSSVINDVRAAMATDNVPPMRAAKRKAQETLGHDPSIEVEERHARKIAALRKRKPAEKELKPGYCENCREKFNDFDEVSNA